MQNRVANCQTTWKLPISPESSTLSVCVAAILEATQVFKKVKHFRPFQSLLASFTVWVIDTALLHLWLTFNQNIRRRTCILHPSRLNTKLVDVNG